MHIKDTDLFDGALALLDSGVALDDPAAVEAVLINPYKKAPLASQQFVAACVTVAKAHKATWPPRPRREEDAAHLLDFLNRCSRGNDR